MNTIFLPGAKASMPNNQTQNISTINNYNLTYQNFHSVLGKSMNNNLYSQEQNINPNRAKVNDVNSIQKIKNYSSNVISNNNQSNNNNNNIENSKSNARKTTTPNSKIIQIKKGKITSSGSLLKSSRSNKFNRVFKNGKKIKNIDINNDCEDTQNDEDSESISTNSIIKRKTKIMENNNLNSSNVITTENKLGSTVETKYLERGSMTTASMVNGSNLIKKTSTQFKKSTSKFIKEKSQNSEVPRDSDEISKQSEKSGALSQKSEVITKTNNQNLKISDQSNIIQKSKAQISSKFKLLNNINNDNLSSQLKKAEFPKQSINQLSNNLKNTSILTSNKISQQPNIQLDKLSNNGSNINDKKSHNSIKDEDLKSKRSESKLSENKMVYQQQINGTIINLPMRKMSNDSNTNSNYSNSNIVVPSPDNNFVINSSEYKQQEAQTQQFITEDITKRPKSQVFRVCKELTQAGKDLEGKIKTNQDTSLICLNVGEIVGFNLFGVLDGHGPHGHFVSQHCKEYFIKNISNYTESLKLLRGLTTAEEIYSEFKNTKFNYIIELYNQVDIELATQDNFDYNLSGTTCNIVFQFNAHLVCANTGDSRGILIYDKGDNTNQGIFPLSIDHKPDLPDELARIELSGGVVDKIKDMLGNDIGPARVFKLGFNYPGLAMSRSLGDLQGKEVGVIPTPQIIECEINASTKYFVVCSDGIWEFTSNEQVRDIGNIYYAKNDIIGFCNELIRFSTSLWEQKEMFVRDDITVVAVFL